MALDPEYKALVESQLDECDAALADKPYLAGIFNEAWRQEHRANMLGADSRADVWYPASYAKPHNDLLYPPDWQQRLEEGASVLLPKLDKRERKHLFSRMRGNGCLSAEEELLLARGFAQVFGPDRIAFPRVGKDKDVPEFHVSIQGTTVEVEAKGLHESEAVRQLNSHAIRTGQLSWITMNPDIDPLRRLRQAIAKKLLSGRTGDVRILVLTQYTPWITPVEAVPLIRGLAIDPGHFGIPKCPGSVRTKTFPSFTSPFKARRSRSRQRGCTNPKRFGS